MVRGQNTVRRHLRRTVRQCLTKRPEHKSSDTPSKDRDSLAESTAQTTSRPLRILVAEDNRTNQQLLVTLLTRLNHHVDIAANGIEAVNAIRDIPYDLVIMDVYMPEMDGLTATKTIRAFAGEKSRIPIIAVSADAKWGSRKKLLAAGMDDYLSKPLDPQELSAAISHVMNP